MALISLEETKEYLHVDSPDDNPMIEALLSAAGILCAEMAGLQDNEWDAINSKSRDEENGTIPTKKLEHRRELMRAAILYTVGYLYRHPKDVKHHELILTLRNLLFCIREGIM